MNSDERRTNNSTAVLSETGERPEFPGDGRQSCRGLPILESTCNIAVKVDQRLSAFICGELLLLCSSKGASHAR
jgi:hypothetical protein